MRGPCELLIKIILVLLKTYLKEINLSLFTIGTFSHRLFKVKQNLSNSLLCNKFQTQSISYNLRSQTDFIRSNASTSQQAPNSMRSFASKLWQMIPLEIKNSVSFESFIEKIRRCEPSSCNYKLCQLHIHNLGYVNPI